MEPETLKFSQKVLNSQTMEERKAKIGLQIKLQ